jgi:phenylacetate-CoA ligase
MFKRLQKFRRKQIIKYLRNTSPEKFESIAEKKLYKTIHKAAKDSPAYKSIVDEKKAELKRVKTLEDFKHIVPITNKLNYFERYTFEQLLGHNEKKMKSAMSSSGYTGTFAYGFVSENAIKNSRLGVDTTFDYWFDISKKRTFLINCAPMGVHVETSLPLAETSVRSDMAIALLKKVSPAFDQTIIGGDPYFLKKLIEEGDEKGINWEKLQVSLITAQDWLPESLRTYLASRIGINPDNSGIRGIYATMGMTELGLNVFHESKYTIGIRRAILKDMELRNLLFQSDMRAAPCIFHYYPFRTYIESIKNKEQDELIFTVTDLKNILPIIRYNTGDAGKIMSYNQLKTVLTPKYPIFIPDLKLPIGILYGRIKNQIIFRNQFLHIEDIKEGLFSDSEVGSKVTGLIKIQSNKDKIYVMVHLKNGILNDTNLKKKIRNAIHTYLLFEVEIQLISYNEFPDAIELNYERKMGS